MVRDIRYGIMLLLALGEGTIMQGMDQKIFAAELIANSGVALFPATLPAKGVFLRGEGGALYHGKITKRYDGDLTDIVVPEAPALFKKGRLPYLLPGIAMAIFHMKTGNLSPKIALLGLGCGIGCSAIAAWAEYARYDKEATTRMKGAANRIIELDAILGQNDFDKKLREQGNIILVSETPLRGWRLGETFREKKLFYTENSSSPQYASAHSGTCPKGVMVGDGGDSNEVMQTQRTAGTILLRRILSVPSTVLPYLIVVTS